MTNNTDTSKKESHSFGLVALALLPVFYLGMTGPIVHFWDRYPASVQRGFEILYAPLDLVTDLWPGAEQLFVDWLAWWLR